MFKNAKLGAVVVLYNPPPEIVFNICSYINQVDHLTIIDNSDLDNAGLFESLSSRNVRYLANHKNLGIATALNQVIDLCYQAGCVWALTMDQDSYFEKNELNRYLSCAAQCNIENAEIFAPNTGTSTLSGSGCMYHKVETVITSGSIINISTLRKLNGFDDKLFIDGVDDDICYRFQLQGKSVIYLPGPRLLHKLGEPRVVRNFLIGKTVSRNLHSPIRLYFMVRNYLYLIHMYGEKFPKKVPEYKRELLIKIKNGLIYDKKRFQVFKYILKGYVDYKKGRFGNVV